MNLIETGGNRSVVQRCGNKTSGFAAKTLGYNTDDDFLEKIYIDIPMPLKFADMPFIKELETLEPYGIGNPKPLFAQKDIYFTGARILGQNANV